MYFDINTLPEVISKENFLFLFNDLMRRRNSLSKFTVIQYLDILGEKFEKFYDINVINDNERDELYKVLKGFTDFNQLNLMESLIGIMFQFRNDKYVDYLKTHLELIRYKDVYNEVHEAINEYGLTN